MVLILLCARTPSVANYKCIKVIPNRTQTTCRVASVLVNKDCSFGIADSKPPPGTSSKITLTNDEQNVTILTCDWSR